MLSEANTPSINNVRRTTQRLLEKVKADTSLQEKLNAATSPEAAIEIAKAAGFSITAEDIQSTQSATVELSDESWKVHRVVYGTLRRGISGAERVTNLRLQSPCAKYLADAGHTPIVVEASH